MKKVNKILPLRRFRLKSTTLPTLILILVGLSASVWLWQSARHDLNTELNNTYTQGMDSITTNVNQLVKSYDNLLNGEEGYFLASNYNVNKDEWNTYIATYDLKDHFPGLLSTGFIKYVPESQLNSFVLSERASEWPEFKVNPDTKKSDYAIIRYYSPVPASSGLNSIGFDMFSESMRRSVLERSLETGDTLSTGAVKFIFEKPPLNNGLIIFNPIYKGDSSTTEARKQNIYGFVYGAVRLADMFDNIITPQQKSSAALRVYSGESKTPDSIVYETDNVNKIEHLPGIIPRSTQVHIKNSTFTVEAFATKNLLLSTSKQNQPLLIFMTGLLATALLALFILYVMRSRSRELSYVKQLEVQSFKDELLSLASHQLRTPATGVKQYIGMVLQGYAGPITKEQQEMLEKANASNERQLEIVDQILHVTKLEAGNTRLYASKIFVRELMQDILDEQAGSIRMNRHTVELIVNKSLYLYGDQQYLRMVFENLISNAIKYMKKRGLLTIRAGAISRDRVVIDVSDTGVGIKPGDYDKLFQKFSRIDNELSIQAGGSGIGLYLARLIVSLHGGTIEALPNKEEGTTFRVILPRGSG